LTLGTTCTICKVQKMLASTMQFSRYGRNHASRPPVREASPAGRSSKATAKGGCPLRTQQCARPPPARRPSFRSPPEGKSVLTGSPRGGRPNSQCSTRKHGRPGEHAPPEGAGAP